MPGLSIRKLLSLLVVSMLVISGCTVDKNHSKYDQLRYDELQKTNCEDMASLLASSLVSTEPEKRENALKRCQDMKSLSFEQYQRLADYARETGDWNVYALFPSKALPSAE